MFLFLKYWTKYEIISAKDNFQIGLDISLSIYIDLYISENILAVLSSFRLGNTLFVPRTETVCQLLGQCGSYWAHDKYE